MAGRNDLLDLERAGWQALSSGGETAARSYGEVLATQVLMLLPGGLLIADRKQAIRSMSGAPWDAFELSDERVDALTDTCSVVTYRASARRGGHNYNALFNSTYILDGSRWRLALHQQTPV